MANNFLEGVEMRPGEGDEKLIEVISDSTQFAQNKIDSGDTAMGTMSPLAELHQ